MNIDTLIADLAKQLQLEDSLQLDEHGYLSLEVNDTLVVNLQWHAADEHLIIFSPLFKLPDDSEEPETLRRQNALLKMLLGANLFWQGTEGGTLSLDNDSGWLWLMDKYPFSVITPPGVLSQRLLQHIEAVKAFAEKGPEPAPEGKQVGDDSQVNNQWIQG
ncbi:type III secretion system chaperone [Hahella sp. HN01]|uniref:type III secretion system chaperone n=1 Tax=Hahella sp. HN01 TaxID=2847262 RepID=UPI001C1ED5E0|nr:type III secretion system chaperone [Hahella sp. HN01]MBU6949830.1 type III secretion system chaperone [Hahella sp. HN01]